MIAEAGAQARRLRERGARIPVRGETAQRRAVGEQPGDEEDRSGRPFVGPSERLLDQTLGDTGIDRTRVYVTNVVKHFKWEPRGRRRIHLKPDAREIAAFRVSRERGAWVRSPVAPRVMATVHPSAPDDGTRRAETARLVADLRKAARLLWRPRAVPR